MAEEPSVDDRQLLHRMRRGDQSAFAAVYERYQGRIFRFALHMTGSRTIAEEITQEVFMLLIRKPAAYDPNKGSLSAYMFGVARNLARRTKGKESTEVFVDDCDEVELVEAPDAAIDEVLSSAESLDLLRKALLGLPELYREAVALCDLEEMSYEQASRVMDCPPGTVASRLHRAHGMLRSKLNRVFAKGCQR
jgi:RNA polymerase sigma-70 factor (ECF subfamily)